jgi:hypothetical protein
VSCSSRASGLVNSSLNLHGTRSVQKIVELFAIDEEKTPAKKDAQEESSGKILTRFLDPATLQLASVSTATEST